MFFEKVGDIPKIAARTGCTVFVLPPGKMPKFVQAMWLEPSEEKKTEVITVEQVREFASFAQNRETKDRFFVISPAEAMNETAQNAFLKTIEEPHDFCHFVLLTKSPMGLLPTIRSRAQVFYPRIEDELKAAPRAKPKQLELAKKLIAASPAQLPQLATEIAKTKTQPRQLAMEVVAVAIELLYKSYFQTKNQKFLAKLPNFIRLHEHLAQNGHIKLHIVADLC